jgi:hypothetical protein
MHTVQSVYNWIIRYLNASVFHVSVNVTLSARPPFQNFSTPCILNVNNTGAKQGSIMKLTAF